MPLASIENIALLLGENNRIGLTAQTVNGLDSADLLLESDAGEDVIPAFDGKDTIVSGIGADTVLTDGGWCFARLTGTNR